MSFVVRSADGPGGNVGVVVPLRIVLVFVGIAVATVDDDALLLKALAKEDPRDIRTL